MRHGALMLDGYAGRQDQHVYIVGETPTRYRIKSPPLTRVKLPGRNRWICDDQTALVPKPAVRMYGTRIDEAGRLYTP